MAKMKIDFKGFDEIMKKLRSLEGDARSVTEEALRRTHEIVTEKAADAVTAPNLPAGGKYSSGRTAASLQRDSKVTWNGTEASVEVGFNIKNGGLPTIFMLYGTPRYMKNQSLYDAFYGTQTEGEIINEQKNIFYKAIDELMGG